MASKTSKPAVETVKTAIVATPAVTLKLQAATESAQTADAFAREAATLANASDYAGVKKPAERLEKILALYASVLTHKAVKESFSAALAILVAAEPVRIVASEKSEKANGSLGFKAPEALAKGEAAPADKIVTELAPADALAKLPVAVMKQAATAARETLGVARAKGGGRKATSNDTARAPFFDEAAAVLKDGALCLQFLTMVEIQAGVNPDLKAKLLAMAKRLEAKK